MKKIGIVIDGWKLPIFSKHLREAGFVYNVTKGPTADGQTITIQCEEEKLEKLKGICITCQMQAARFKQTGKL